MAHGKDYYIKLSVVLHPTCLTKDGAFALVLLPEGLDHAGTVTFSWSKDKCLLHNILPGPTRDL